MAYSHKNWTVGDVFAPVSELNRMEDNVEYVLNVWQPIFMPSSQTTVNASAWRETTSNTNQRVGILRGSKSFRYLYFRIWFNSATTNGYATITAGAGSKEYLSTAGATVKKTVRIDLQSLSSGADYEVFFLIRNTTSGNTTMGTPAGYFFSADGAQSYDDSITY